MQWRLQIPADAPRATDPSRPNAFACWVDVAAAPRTLRSAATVSRTYGDGSRRRCGTMPSAGLPHADTSRVMTGVPIFSGELRLEPPTPVRGLSLAEGCLFIRPISRGVRRCFDADIT